MRIVSRRVLLKGSLAAARSAAAAALLAACGGGGATDIPKPVATTGATASTTAATAGTSNVGAPATAASGGKTAAELKVAVAALPKSMDPHEEISNVGMRIHYFTFDTLIRRDFLDNSKLVPPSPPSGSARTTRRSN